MPQFAIRLPSSKSHLFLDKSQKHWIPLLDPTGTNDKDRIALFGSQDEAKKLMDKPEINSLGPTIIYWSM